MRIISYSAGTLIALYPLEAFVPLRFTGARAMLELIGNVYKFQDKPALSASLEDISSNGYEFNIGELDLGEGPITVRKLSIHNDGMLVVTSNTDDSERVFDHLYNWLISEGAFREVQVRRLFLSELVVKFDRPLSKLFAAYESLEQAATRFYKDDGREFSARGLNGFSIGADGLEKENPRFHIEKRTGTNFGDETYFCAAPLKTGHHEASLEEIENLI